MHYKDSYPPLNSVSKQTSEYGSIPPVEEAEEELELLNSTKENSKEKILINTLLFGLRTFFVGVHFVGNGLIMAQLGPNEHAASSITTAFQSFLIGAGSGLLQTIGSELGSAKADKDDDKISSIVKMGWVMSILCGLITTCIFISTRWFFPLLLERKTARIASDFFSTFSFSAIPDLVISTNNQIIFQLEEDQTFFPVFISSFYRMFALILSYYFGKQMKLNAFGVGLGAAIAGWIAIVPFQLWFSRKHYHKYNLSHYWIIDDFNKKFLHSLTEGTKFSLQRMTEWGNLEAITQTIGTLPKSNRHLRIIQPSIILLTLCNVLSQGFAQASMMIAATDTKTLKNNLKKSKVEFLNKQLINDIRKNIDTNYKNHRNIITSGLVCNTVLIIFFYIAQKHIIDWYLHNSCLEDKTLAKEIILINAISLIPDTVRMITAAILRGWGEVMHPTITNFFLMTAIGVPLGFLIDHTSFAAVFVVRVITLILSAALNYHNLYSYYNEDELNYDLVDFSYELFQLLDQFKLRIENHENNNKKYQALFPLLSTLNLHEVPVDEYFIKKKIVKNILDNIGHYLEYMISYQNRDDFFKKFNNPDDDIDKLLFIVVSQTFSVNILLIKNNHSMIICCRQGSKKTICINYTSTSQQQVSSLSSQIDPNSADMIIKLGQLKHIEIKALKKNANFFKSSLLQKNSNSISDDRLPITYR